MSYFDYEGNEFANVKEMCEHYGVAVSTFYSKLNCGYSLYEILNKVTTPYIDHEGNEFKSLREMCRYWGMTTSTYYNKKKTGKSMSEIFKESSIIVDKYGNRFKNPAEFCRYYKLRQSTYSYYVNTKNMTTDEIVELIELKIQRKHKLKSVVKNNYNILGTPIEFDGKYFLSISELCRTYNIKTNTFYKRRERGFTFAECIFGRDKEEKYVPEPHRVYDHLGNVFHSEIEMCDYHNISFGTYRCRKNKGWNIERCLSPNRQYKDSHGNQIFYLGKNYESTKSLCNAFNINYNSFQRYKSYNKLDTKTALDKYIEIRRIKNLKKENSDK